MATFLIAEDHCIVRMGIKLAVTDIYPEAKITETGTFDGVISNLNSRGEDRYDLLFLDINMPGGNNLNMIDTVRLRQPELPILIFTSYEEKFYAMQYIAAGANGFLNKNAHTDELKLAISRILSGARYISDAMQQELIKQSVGTADKKKKNVPLSNKEMEIMQELMKGKRSSDIKAALNIHSSTLSTYKARIFAKMGVETIVELVDKVKSMNR